MPNFANPILNRVLTHWPTTLAGAVLSAFAGYALKQFGPCLPPDWTQWALGALTVVGPVVLGGIAKAT